MEGDFKFLPHLPGSPGERMTSSGTPWFILTAKECPVMEVYWWHLVRFWQNLPTGYRAVSVGSEVGHTQGWEEHFGTPPGKRHRQNSRG